MFKLILRPVIRLFNIILIPLKALEKGLYLIRDSFYNLPEILLGNNSFKDKLKKFQKATSPYSNFLISFIFVFVFSALLLTNNIPKIVSANNNTLREAVVVGQDRDGNLQRISKVNPLIPSNIQLEKDLIELIYEPLLRYEYLQRDDGTWTSGPRPILADKIIEIRQGADYQFNLKRGVLWHDNSNTDKREFSADDVIRTFDILATLDVQSAYIQAIKQLRWEKLDQYTVRICTKSPNPEVEVCDGGNDSPIFSNFLELVSVKIIPEHLSSDINSDTASNSNAKLFRSPIGTGKYKFESINDNSITLKKNLDYYIPFPENSNIEEINFVFYESLEKAVAAIQSGEVHSLSSVSVEYKNQLEDIKNLETYKSPILDTQFWGLYFNLRTKPDGEAIGPSFLLDQKVRQAISSAVSRTNIINEALEGVGEEAMGPIPAKSYFYNEAAEWYSFDIIKAQKLLDEAGWTMKPNQEYRTNDKGEELKFDLYFVESYDRRRAAEIIQRDLAKIGVKAVIDRREQRGQDQSENAPNGWELEELNNQVLSPRSFDVLLYGMNTFIDPDRYELYHSSQQVHPKLNISGYVGLEETVVAKTAEERKDSDSSIKRVSKVDRLLEQTRTFDPETSRDERKANYDEFQTLLAEDAPVVYLYHPEFLYYYHDELSGVSLDNVTSVEDRFRSIQNWNLN